MTQRYQNELEKESPKNEAAKATPEASKNTRETNDEIQEDNTEDSPKNESAKATPEASKNTGETNDERRKDNTRAKSFFWEVLIGIVVGAIGGGTMIFFTHNAIISQLEIQVQENTNKIEKHNHPIDRDNIEKIMELSPRVEKIEENISERSKIIENIDERIETLEKFHKNCDGKITKPVNNLKVNGNIQVEGSIFECQEHRIWLVVSPITGAITNQDCYVQGEIIDRNSVFNQGTTSIGEPQKYLVYLVGIPTSSSEKNQKLVDAQNPNNPKIKCSDISLAEHNLDNITVDNR